MRPWWWACIVVAVLACPAAYLLFQQPSSTSRIADAFDESEQRPLAQKPDEPPLGKDETRPNFDTASADLKPDQTPVSQEPARYELASLPAEHPPEVTASQQPARQELASLPAELPVAPELARPDAAVVTGAIGAADPTLARQSLSYLAYYAYSELPPEIKPADIVLDSLKDMPHGTPIEEIRRVAEALGLDVTFMMAVAKIESNFNPKARTGSYMGVFQMSRREFAKYGSGDILVARDNTIAAALKMITEAILFERFTRRKPTVYDFYLIHQQGIDGAAEHVSHPKRVAWRSMCATDEGKEKGERWCRRAIWGNTLPKLKREWKKVDNVTSAAFVAMWQQRMTHFYARYSEAATN